MQIVPATFDQQLVAARLKIDDLLKQVQAGKLRVPRFQRGLRWGTEDVIRLFDSLYRGFPVGTLLFWVRPASAEQVTLGPIRLDAPAVDECYWVVDGQQRVTSLAGALLPNPTSSEFDLTFDLESELFMPLRANAPEHALPLREAYELPRVLEWVTRRELTGRQKERAFRLADRLRNYEIPAYLVHTADEQTLQMIFDRSNTYGKAMRRSEIFQALNSTVAGGADDVATLDERVRALGAGGLNGNTLLYAVLAVNGPDVLREFRSEFNSAEDRRVVFERAFAAIGAAITFLRDELDVPHLELVPYQHQTVGLVRFFALHPDAPSHHRVLLRRWFWRAAELGPLALLGSSGTLRATTNAVTDGSSLESVKRLLDLAAGPPSDLLLGGYRWASATTRIAVCALASLRPLDVRSRTRIDVSGAIEAAGREALVPLVRDRSGLGTSIANRVFVPPDLDESDDDYLARLGEADPTVLASLGLPASPDLTSRDPKTYLHERASLLKGTVEEFLRVRTERDQPTRASIAELASEDD